MLKNNPDFKEVFTIDKYSFYAPTQVTRYHKSRELEANNQIIFASSGATKDVLLAHLNEIINICNAPTAIATTRTDIAAICNALIYRTSKPVDEKCAIRLGALLTFLEYEEDGVLQSEPPNEVKPYWLDKKMQLALQYPDLYTFFLSMGIVHIPQYNELSDTLNNVDYFITRREGIQSLLPPRLPQLANL